MDNPSYNRVFSALYPVLDKLRGNTQPEGVADLLWLATFVRMGEVPAKPGLDQAFKPPTKIVVAPNNTITQGTTPRELVAQIVPGRQDSKPVPPVPIPLPVPPQPTVALPSPGTLGDHLPFLRALRPLRTRVPGPPGNEIDEVATVERITEERLWEPVLQPTQQRAWAATVVIDGSPSMRLWRSRIGEVVRLVVNLGAFAGIEWRHLDTAGALRPGPPLGMRLGLPAVRTLPPRARPLTIVVTDGLDKRWADGSVGEALGPLARKSSLALLHLFPFRLWSRTSLGRTVLPVTIKDGRARLDDEYLNNLDDDLDENTFTAAPLVDLAPEALHAWARLEQRGAGVWPAGAVVSAVRREVALAPAAEESVRLARFRNTASPAARRLAALLSLADRVELPLARAVREACIPGAGFAEEVEVLLGGIFEVSKEDPARPEAVELTMIAAAREALRWEVRRDDLPGLFRELARWLRNRPEVPADVLGVLMNPDSAERIRLDPGNALVSGLLDAMRLAGGRWGEIAEDAAPSFDLKAEEAWLDVAALWLKGNSEEPAPIGRRAARAVRKRHNVDEALRTGSAAMQLLAVRVMGADSDPAGAPKLVEWLSRLDQSQADQSAQRSSGHIPARLVIEALGEPGALGLGRVYGLADHVSRWLKQQREAEAGEPALEQIRMWVAASPATRLSDDELASFVEAVDSAGMHRGSSLSMMLSGIDPAALPADPQNGAAPPFEQLPGIAAALNGVRLVDGRAALEVLLENTRGLAHDASEDEAVFVHLLSVLRGAPVAPDASPTPDDAPSISGSSLGRVGPVKSVAWSPDGKRIVVASQDNAAQIWNVDGSGEPLVFKGHQGVVNSAAWSPDGGHIVTASEDTTARIWSVDEMTRGPEP